MTNDPQAQHDRLMFERGKDKARDEVKSIIDEYIRDDSVNPNKLIMKLIKWVKGE